MAKKPQQLILINGSGGGQNWDIRCRFKTLVAILILGLVSGAVYLTTQSGILTLDVQPSCNNDDMITCGTSNSNNSLEKCDLFSGKWVFDNSSYPLYKESQCKFMSDQLACEKFGRKDLGYQYWRWQPHRCDLPRFNATALLERLRNKRMVFVGDSLNRGQWVSMLCLLQTSMPSSHKYSMLNNGSNLISFKAKEYNASIDFYWAPLLVESNSDDPVKHRLPERIVRAQSIEKHARHWTNADFLVFNTYLWWRRHIMKILWGSFERPDDGVYKEVEMLRSYEMALRTWSEWLEFHVDHNRTQLFFMSMAPTHERAEEWGKSKGENCYKETEMISKEKYWGNGSDPKMMRIVESTIDDLKKKNKGLINLQIINITQLSEYRKEGHPSIYRKQWDPLTEEQISDPSTYADCIHWCLPGLPDVWNELLYAFIFNYHLNPINIHDL